MLLLVWLERVNRVDEIEAAGGTLLEQPCLLSTDFLLRNVPSNSTAILGHQSSQHPLLVRRPRDSVRNA